MADTLGWRLKLGVLVPSTNTSVQPERRSAKEAKQAKEAASRVVQRCRSGACERGLHFPAPQMTADLLSQRRERKAGRSPSGTAFFASFASFAPLASADMAW